MAPLAQIIVLLAASTALAKKPKKVSQANDPAYQNHTVNFEASDSAGNIIEPFPIPGPGASLYWGMERGPYHFASGFPYGVAPHTFPNYVSFASTNTTLQGVNMTTRYEDSQVVSFTLHELYFGCDVRTTDQHDLEIVTPVPCTLYVYGRHAVDPALHPVAAEVRRYEPHVYDNPHLFVPTAPMQGAGFGTHWEELDLVWFNATSDVPGGVNVYLDSFKYTTHNSTQDK